MLLCQHSFGKLVFHDVLSTCTHSADKVKRCLSVGQHEVVVEAVVGASGALGQHVTKSEINIVISIIVATHF